MSATLLLAGCNNKQWSVRAAELECGYKVSHLSNEEMLQGTIHQGTLCCNMLQNHIFVKDTHQTKHRIYTSYSSDSKTVQCSTLMHGEQQRWRTRLTDNIQVLPSHLSRT
ncbi:hypothetical protein BsWGS_09750 [Bradybaena similaris]